MQTMIQREIFVRKMITSKLQRYDDMEKQPVGSGIPEETRRYLAYCRKFKIGGGR